MAHRQRYPLLRSNAPDMPVPNLNRDQGAPLPQIPMAAPQFSDPFQSRGGGTSDPWLLNSLKSEGTKLWGGYDPTTGIDWDTGRQGVGGLFGSPPSYASGPGSLPNPSGFAESFGGPLGGGGGFSASSISPFGWAAMITAGKTMQAQDPDSFMGKALHGLLGPSISQGLADPLNTLLGPFQGFTSSKARNTPPEWMGMGK